MSKQNVPKDNANRIYNMEHGINNFNSTVHQEHLSIGSTNYTITGQIPPGVGPMGLWGVAAGQQPPQQPQQNQQPPPMPNPGLLQQQQLGQGNSNAGGNANPQQQ